MYRQLLVLGLSALTMLPGVAIPAGSFANAQTLDRAAPLDFKGRYLVSISDADMVASAYVNG